MTPFTFNTTPSVRFVSDGLNDLAGTIGGLLGGTIVIVTDRGLVATGIPERAVQAMTAAGAQVHLFDSVEADPPEAVIMAATQLTRDENATGMIGLGGGSSLGVAKLAAALAKSGATLEASYGIGNLAQGRLPLVLIPTTAGTGSEVTPISIVTTGENTKMGIVSPVMLPDIALLDPMLTVGLPAHVTAATGVDAMVHAIEAYCSVSPNNNPVSRALACEALRLMGPALETAVAEPENIAARSDMLLGSLLAGQAFANSARGGGSRVGLSHRRAVQGAAWPVQRAGFTACTALQYPDRAGCLCHNRAAVVSASERCGCRCGRSVS